MINLQGIDHVALAVRDIKRSLDWYSHILGLTRRYPEWGEYPAMIGIGTTSLALFPMDKDEEQPITRGRTGMLHLAFRASREEFANAQKHLTEHGIPFEFQDHEIAHSIYFEDPDGHRLEITTYEV